MPEHDGGPRRRDLVVQVSVALAVAAVTFGTAQLTLLSGASPARPTESSAPPTRSSAPSPTPTPTPSPTPATSPGRRELARLDPSRESSLRSADGDPRPVDVQVVNQGAITVRSFWLDYEGHRRDYGTLAPGEEMHLETYERHPWVFATLQGKALFIVLPGTKPGIVTIT